MRTIQDIIDDKKLSSEDKSKAIAEINEANTNKIVEERLAREKKSQEKIQNLKDTYGEKWEEAKAKLDAGYDPEDVKTLLVKKEEPKGAEPTPQDPEFGKTPEPTDAETKAFEEKMKKQNEEPEDGYKKLIEQAKEDLDWN